MKLLRILRKLSGGFILFLFVFIFLEIINVRFQGASLKLSHILASMQFIPALSKFAIAGVLSGAVALLILIAVTFLFGRVYCSVLCPLGVLQDFFIWIKYKIFRKKWFSFHSPPNVLRYGICIVTLVLLIAGHNIIATFLDPYTNFGRIAAYGVKPIVAKGSEKLSEYFTAHDMYFIPEIRMQVVAGAVFVVSLVSLVLLAVISFWRGRWFCNYICPTGTALGIISRNSLFKVSIEKDTCVSCGLCSQVCKAECIDVKEKEIINERCVACFNCQKKCNKDAVKFKAANPFAGCTGEDNGEDEVRRSMLRTGIALGVSVVAAFGLRQLVKRRTPSLKKDPPVIPPGAGDITSYSGTCTGCGLCVTACPTKVLVASFNGTGHNAGLLKPVLDFNKSYCLYECTDCSNICPTGAIKPLTLEAKKTTQIGKVKLMKEKCIAWMAFADCTICDEYCPTKAVHAIPHPKDERIGVPKVEPHICVGCGACENVCPAYPEKAIIVESNKTHLLAELPPDVKTESSGKLEEFPF
ncbi:MAG: 4Fe-4S dicluster domain-containing protein [Planctomycetota bacterium]|jgi:polyferredoxin